MSFIRAMASRCKILPAFRAGGQRSSIHIVLFVAGLMWGLPGATVFGGTITLQDKNSVVTIDPNSQSGVNGWTVDGTNQLSQQWFWFRVGDTGPESSIDTLGLTSSSTYHGTQGANVVYGDPNNGLSVEVDYLLNGDSSFSRQSALNETLTISNKTATAQTIHFFQYSNFVLEGGSGQDSVQFPNANTAAQTNSDLYLAETTANPAPNRYEGSFVPNTKNSLNDGSPTVLSDTPVVGGPAVGPGNMSSTYEWDQTIQPGSNFVITVGNRLSSPVPEPSTVALLFVAGLAITGRAWRRRPVSH
jgi:hypothetical protein